MTSDGRQVLSAWAIAGLACLCAGSAIVLGSETIAQLAVGCSLVAVSAAICLLTQ
jgi:hypothetical protein